MAVNTEKSIALFLVLSFLQVFLTQARHTEFVFGPREHLDSGQEPPLQLLNSTFEDSFEYDDEGDAFVQALSEFLQKNKEVDYFDLEGSDEDDDYDSDDYNLNGEEEDDEDYSHDASALDDYYYVSHVPLSRVRRRIIPVGKAMDRGRSDGGGPFGRSRNPWEGPPNRNKDAVVRRNGPTGSAALFSLYPELAPPDWKAKKGVKTNTKKKKSSHQERDTAAIKERNSKKKTESAAEDEGVPASESTPVKKKKTPRRKSKISKRIKEDIAKFAEEHGVERAVTHFKSRVNAPLRAESVEKFLRRYKQRMERRASRT